MQELMNKAKYFCKNRKEIYEKCGNYKSNSENKIQLLNIRLVEPIVEKVLVEKEQVISEKTVKSFKF